MGKYCCGKIWYFGGICRCFTHQLLPFILSCSYTSDLFVHILSSNCFGLAHSPMFYPTKIFPRSYSIYTKWVLIRVRICCLCAHVAMGKVSAGPEFPNTPLCALYKFPSIFTNISLLIF